jgi:hypothetical protein
MTYQLVIQRWTIHWAIPTPQGVLRSRSIRGKPNPSFDNDGQPVLVLSTGWVNTGIDNGQSRTKSPGRQPIIWLRAFHFFSSMLLITMRCASLVPS